MCCVCGRRLTGVWCAFVWTCTAAVSICGGVRGAAEIPTGGEGDKTWCVYCVAVLVPWNSVQQGVKP